MSNQTLPEIDIRDAIVSVDLDKPNLVVYVSLLKYFTLVQKARAPQTISFMTLKRAFKTDTEIVLYADMNINASPDMAQIFEKWESKFTISQAKFESLIYQQPSDIISLKYLNKDNDVLLVIEMPKPQAISKRAVSEVSQKEADAW